MLGVSLTGEKNRMKSKMRDVAGVVDVCPPYKDGIVYLPPPPSDDGYTVVLA